MLPNQLFSLVAVTVVPVLGALAHGHDQEPLSGDADWAARHLAGAHQNLHYNLLNGSLINRQRNITYRISMPGPSSHYTTTTPH